MRSDALRSITPELGVVRICEDFGEDSPFVVHVTEAHGNRSAIRLTAEICATVLRDSDIDLLCIEALSGEFDPGMTRRWRERRTQYPHPGRMVEKGEIELVEFLGLTVEKDFDIFGVEDQESYVRVTKLMRKLAPDIEGWATVVEGLLADLHSDGLGSTSPGYSEFFRTCGAEGIAGLPPLELLIAYSNELGIDPSGLRNFEALIETKRIEATIDFDAANREAQEVQALIIQAIADREGLLTRSFASAGFPADSATPRTLLAGLDRHVPAPLSLCMSKTPAGRLMRHARNERDAPQAVASAAEASAEYERAFDDLQTELASVFQGQSAGSAGLAAVFTFTLEFMTLLDVDVARYPNLVRYAQYLNRFLGANLHSAVGELEALKSRIIARLATTADDRLHAGLLERMSLLASMVRLQQTRTDVKRLQSASREMSHGRLCADLERLLPASALLEQLRGREAEFEGRFEDTMSYFTHMVLRANAMIKNALTRMYETGRESAILLTGGFHQETVAANLSRQRVSFATVMPSIKRATTAEETQAYLSTLLRQ